MTAGGGDDVIAINEASGALPATTMNGDGGNDTLTGGSGGDELHGGPGDDTILSKGGVDTVTGGSGADTMTSGDANDAAAGGADDDTFVWTPGDDTDTSDGGTGVDVQLVNGGNGAEDFSLTRNASVGIFFRRVNPAPFQIDGRELKRVRLLANGGDDTFNAGNDLTGFLQVVEADLGAGAAQSFDGSDLPDIVTGGPGSDVIITHDGDDTIVAGGGADALHGDAGTDNLMGGAGPVTVRNTHTAAITVRTSASEAIPRIAAAALVRYRATRTIQPGARAQIRLRVSANLGRPSSGGWQRPDALCGGRASRSRGHRRSDDCEAPDHGQNAPQVRPFDYWAPAPIRPQRRQLLRKRAVFARLSVSRGSASPSASTLPARVFTRVRLPSCVATYQRVPPTWKRRSPLSRRRAARARSPGRMPFSEKRRLEVSINTTRPRRLRRSVRRSARLSSSALGYPTWNAPPPMTQ